MIYDKRSNLKNLIEVMGKLSAKKLSMSLIICICIFTCAHYWFQISGFLISRYRPSARFLSGWNVVLGFGYFGALVSVVYFDHGNCSKPRSSIQ